MNPCALTKPTLSLVSVTGSKVDFFFHGRKIRVFVSGKEVKDLPKNLQKIQNAIQLRLFMKNAYVLTRETKDSPFLHIRQRGLGGQPFAVEINGVVIVGNTPNEFLQAVIPHLQRLGAHEGVIRNLQDQVHDQNLQAVEFQNQINMLVLQLQQIQDETRIDLYQERLRGGDFFNAAIYFAKVSQTSRTTLLNALIQGRDSKIFQLGFNLASNSAITEGREIVNTEFPRQVADIILHHDTRQFGFSLSNLNGKQDRWEMASGNLEQDKRNMFSFWAMLIHPDGTQGRGDWKLVPEEKGKFFYIRFPDPSLPEERWYYLSSHRCPQFPSDIRNDDSSWIHIHRPGFGGKKWELRYLPEDTFLIFLGEGQWLQQAGWSISAHRDTKKDIRHELSTYMIAQSPQSENPCQWKIQLRPEQNGG